MAKNKQPDLMARVRAFHGKQRKTARVGATAFLALRVPPAMKKKIEAAAAEQGISVNSYMQDLVAAKANGNPGPDPLAAERAVAAQREIRSELETSTASVREVRDRLDGMRKFWRGMVADVEDTLRAGKFSWWSGTPDEETKRMLATLETQMRACADSLAQTRSAILAARPKKTSRGPGPGESLMDSIVGGK